MLISFLALISTENFKINFYGLDRDGQIKQISAYYLLADSGSDPIISDVLGIKKGQLEGVKNPNGELFEHLITDGGGIKRLAEHILNKKVA